jgi:hypothetical protein
LHRCWVEPGYHQGFGVHFLLKDVVLPDDWKIVEDV